MLPLLLDKWHQTFGKLSPERIVKAPGRVNIIGEHTDYNNGYVLPGAMSRSLYVLVSKSTDEKNHWIANDLGEEVTTNDSTSLPSWAKYITGAISLYSPDIGPLKILIGGDLPIGAGISSSSALTCGFLLALQQLTGSDETREELALLGSRVEREVIGVQGGIMDQYAIMLCQPKHLLLLDCRSRSFQHIKVELEDCKWILINTKVKHDLIESDYNQRADECRQAVALIQSKYPKIESIREVTEEVLEKADLPATLLKRCRFVLEENERVLQMVKALQSHDALSAGHLLAASHKGLKEDYEVSCTELNHLADFANQHKDVFGARMMGGGFGGCIFALVKTNACDDFSNACAASYVKRFSFLPEFIHFDLASAATCIS